MIVIYQRQKLQASILHHRSTDLRNKILKKRKKNKSKAVRKTSHDANAPRSPIEFREIATGAKITRPRSRFDRSAGLSDRGKSDARKIAPLRPRLTP